MKMILSVLIIAFFSVSTFANVTSDNQYLLNHDGAIGQKSQLGTLMNGTRNLLVARYSFAVQGGGSAADISLITNLADKKSYAQIPKGAIVTNAWVDVVTPIGSAGPGSVTTALKVKTAGDILDSGGSTGSLGLGVSHFVQGVPTGATTTFFKASSTAASTVKLTIGVAPVISGKFNVYIEYVLGTNTN